MLIGPLEFRQSPLKLCITVIEVFLLKIDHFLNVVYVSHHSAAQRPEPPHEEQGQQQEQHQQGDEEDGAVELGSKHTHT